MSRRELADVVEAELRSAQFQQEEDADAGARPVSPRAWPRRVRSRVTPLGVTAFLALVGYVVAGVWMRHGIDYAIGDALVRNANADQILHSRDPHLAALGFVWPPFPTLVQLPFALVLAPFGQAELAAPVSTACLMALTVVVLGRLLRELALGRVVRSLILLSFVANPVVVFYAGIGMSEASAFLFLAMALRGFLAFVRDRKTASLVYLGFGLAGLVLSRVEGLGVVLAFGVAVALLEIRWRDKARAVTSAMIAVLPALWAFGLWLLAQWIITGDLLFFLHSGTKQEAPTLEHSPYLPDVDRDPFEAVRYTARWVLLYSPAFVLGAVPMFVGRWRRIVAGIGVVGAACVFPVVTMLLLLRHGSLGDPRYFCSAVLVGTVVAAYLVASTRRGILRFATASVLVVALFAGWGSSVWGLRDPVNTKTEGEAVVFARFTDGEVERAALLSRRGTVDNWRRVAAALDDLVGPGELVMIDARVAFYAQLFSRHPDRFVADSDRDYARIYADPGERIDYAVALTGEDEAARGDRMRLLIARNPAAWDPIAQINDVALYRRVGDPGSESNSGGMG